MREKKPYWENSRSKPSILLFSDNFGRWSVDIDTPDYEDYLWYCNKRRYDFGLPRHQIEWEIASERGGEFL